MHLYSTITHYLQAGLLPKLAQASALPEGEAHACAEAAVVVLVQQLAHPTDQDELNARWDMCRQLYLSQLLVNKEELLRTDLGWPDRRRYLAEKLLGPAQVAALSATAQPPAAASALLGYLTILVLAIVGEHASQANLNPTALGHWLRQQAVPLSSPPVLAKPAAGVTPPAASPAEAAAAPGPPQPAKRSRLAAVGVASLVFVGLGGYFVLGKSSPTVIPAAAVVAEVPSSVPAAPAVPAAEVPVAAMAPAAAPTTKPVVLPPKAVAAGPVLRDTIGNASTASAIGGRFNVAAGRYLKGEGRPLIIKLANRATLTVGINSTESLLYKRLVNPALPRPSDVVLDRLAFDAGRAGLGAEGAQQLGSVASLLKTFPKVRVLVLGHANPTEDDAAKLGLKRATAAVEELQKQGIAPSRLQAQGVLATGTPADNDSAERQAMLQGISLKISRL